MGLEEAIKLLSVYKKRYTKYEVIITAEELHTLNKENFKYEVSEAIDTVLKNREKLENRYLELTINGKTFKIKNDVKKLKYTDFKDNEFTLEVLEKWN